MFVCTIAATPQLCSVASPADIASLASDPNELPGSAADLSSIYDVICRVSQAAEEVCMKRTMYFALVHTHTHDVSYVCSCMYAKHIHI